MISDIFMILFFLFSQSEKGVRLLWEKSKDLGVRKVNRRTLVGLRLVVIVELSKFYIQGSRRAVVGYRPVVFIQISTLLVTNRSKSPGEFSTYRCCRDLIEAIVGSRFILSNQNQVGFIYAEVRDFEQVSDFWSLENSIGSRPVEVRELQWVLDQLQSLNFGRFLTKIDPKAPMRSCLDGMLEPGKFLYMERSKSSTGIPTHLLIRLFKLNV